jgi:hypothetical protein
VDDGILDMLTVNVIAIPGVGAVGDEAKVIIDLHTNHSFYKQAFTTSEMDRAVVHVHCVFVKHQDFLQVVLIKS